MLQEIKWKKSLINDDEAEYEKIKAKVLFTNSPNHILRQYNILKKLINQ